MEVSEGRFLLGAETFMGQVIEADEQGRLLVPAELLADAQPHGRYIVETSDNKLLIKPEETVEQRKQAYEEWKRDWDALTEEISAAWTTDKSAAEIISEMRR